MILFNPSGVRPKADFDPDAYLAETEGKPDFDPDAYLAEVEKPSLLSRAGKAVKDFVIPREPVPEPGIRAPDFDPEERPDIIETLGRRAKQGVQDFISDVVAEPPPSKVPFTNIRIPERARNLIQLGKAGVGGAAASVAELIPTTPREVAEWAALGLAEPILAGSLKAVAPSAYEFLAKERRAVSPEAESYIRLYLEKVGQKLGIEPERGLTPFDFKKAVQEGRVSQAEAARFDQDLYDAMLQERRKMPPPELRPERPVAPPPPEVAVQPESLPSDSYFESLSSKFGENAAFNVPGYGVTSGTMRLSVAAKKMSGLFNLTGQAVTDAMTASAGAYQSAMESGAAPEQAEISANRAFWGQIPANHAFRGMDLSQEAIDGLKSGDPEVSRAVLETIIETDPELKSLFPKEEPAAVTPPSAPSVEPFAEPPVAAAGEFDPDAYLAESAPEFEVIQPEKTAPREIPPEELRAMKQQALDTALAQAEAKQGMEVVEPAATEPEPTPSKRRLKGPKSILQFIRANGRIDPNYPGGSSDIREFQRIDLMNTKTGKSLAEMAEAAREMGYLPKDSADTDLLDLIRDEIGGKKIYSQRDVDEIQPEYNIFENPRARAEDFVNERGRLMELKVEKGLTKKQKDYLQEIESYMLDNLEVFAPRTEDPALEEPIEPGPKFEAVNLGGQVQDQALIPGTPGRELPGGAIQPRRNQVEARNLLDEFKPDNQPKLEMDETEPAEGGDTSFEFAANPYGKAAKTLIEAAKGLKKKVTETPEFRRWFGKSKVVDEKGEPLVVYHGTTATIKEFDPKLSDEFNVVTGDENVAGYFTDEPSVASIYAGERGGSNVLPVYLKLNNPLVFKGTEIYGNPSKSHFDKIVSTLKTMGETRVSNWIQEQGKSNYSLLNGLKESKSGMVAVLRKAGFDGIIIEAGSNFGKNSDVDDLVRHKVFIALEPSQIKSATGNRGTFDPTSPSILHSNPFFAIFDEIKKLKFDKPKPNLIARAQILKNELKMEDRKWLELKQKVAGKTSLTEMSRDEIGQVGAVLDRIRKGKFTVDEFLSGIAKEKQDEPVAGLTDTERFFGLTKPFPTTQFPAPKEKAGTIRTFGDFVGARSRGAIVKSAGELGKAFVDEIDMALRYPTYAAGKLNAALKEIESRSKLTQDEIFNLKESLEGRQKPMNEAVKEYFDVMDHQRRTIRDMRQKQIAENPAQPDLIKRKESELWGLKNYFHHQIPNVDSLAQGEPMRKEIVADMVRRGAVKSASEAEQMISEYIAFVKKNATPETILKYLVESGQAKNIQDAVVKLNRMRQFSVKFEEGAFMPREIDLPFYDPNPLRVVPNYNRSVMRYLYLTERFGQDAVRLLDLAEKIDAAGGNREVANTILDYIMQKSKTTDFSKVGKLLRDIQVIEKMSYSAISNFFQGQLGTSLILGPRVALKTKLQLRRDMEGAKKWAVRVGQNPDMALLFHEDLGDWTRRFLRLSQFSRTETGNYVFATTAGKVGAMHFFKRLQKNPSDSEAIRKLTMLGIDHKAALERGYLTDFDLVNASDKAWRESQGIPNILNLPQRWLGIPLDSEAGRLIFQFKTVAYNQSRIIWENAVKEAAEGNIGGLLTLLILFPAAGEIIEDLKSMVTGKERRTDGWRYLEDMSGAFGFGILNDVFWWTKYGISMGPTFAQANELFAAARNPKLIKKQIKNIPFVGRRIYNKINPDKKKKPKSIESQMNAAERKLDRQMKGGL